MNELVEALGGESAHAAPMHILEAVPGELSQRAIAGAPHTIYQEVWHLAFWQQITLDWIGGVETAYSVTPSDPFPTRAQQEAEEWPQLCRRFLDGLRQAASAAADSTKLAHLVRCPSRPGLPVRVMTVEEQLISLAAHNAYHLGRIVLLRQLLGVWPPPSGGFSW